MTVAEAFKEIERHYSQVASDLDPEGEGVHYLDVLDLMVAHGIISFSFFKENEKELTKLMTRYGKVWR